MIEVQKNNPLHGLKLEVLLTELVEHYGWEVLADSLRFNCFTSNPSIKSSLKFLRKTPWAREKLEGFYLYKYKRLPKPDDVQYELPPRDRTVPLEQKPRTPAVITVKEDTKDTEAFEGKGSSSYKDSSAYKDKSLYKGKSPSKDSSSANDNSPYKSKSASQDGGSTDAWAGWRNKSKD